MILFLSNLYESVIKMETVWSDMILFLSNLYESVIKMETVWSEMAKASGLSLLSVS